MYVRSFQPPRQCRKEHNGSSIRKPSFQVGTQELKHLADKWQSTKQAELKIVSTEQQRKSTEKDAPTDSVCNVDMNIGNRTFPDGNE